jgi:hypothetical protein
MSSSPVAEIKQHELEHHQEPAFPATISAQAQIWN